MKQDNKNSYNKIADAWDERRKNKATDPCIVNFAAMLSPHSKILDVGCGSGCPISKYLVEHSHCVTGIDMSEAMVEKANALHLQNASFFTCDFMEWHTDSLYDAVIAFDSLWHIPYDKQKLIYPKIASHLKPNGLLLFTHGKTDGGVQGDMYGQTFYYNALDGCVVRQILEENSFQVLSWIENYEDRITGTRDLLVIAKKAH